MLGYAQQRYLAYAVAIALAGWAIVQAANPADYGLTPIMVRWLGVIMSMLGVAAGFLPSVRGRSTDPEFLADRVSELPAHEQRVVIGGVQERAGDAAVPAAFTPEQVGQLADELERRRQERVDARLRQAAGADFVAGTPPLPPAREMKG